MPSATREEEEDPEEEGTKAKKPRVQAVDAKTAAEAIERLKAYVAHELSRARKRGGKKDDYKDGLVYTERRVLLDDVLKVQQRPWRVKCSRCGA